MRLLLAEGDDGADVRTRLAACGWLVVERGGDLVLDAGGVADGEWSGRAPLLRLGAASGPGGRHDASVAAGDGLCAALERWRPLPVSATTLRLRDAFGEGPLGTLLAGLRDQLLALLAADEIPANEPHRLVGLAGTLGFATLGEAWRRVMDAESDALADARRLSRLAIGTIDRIDFVPGQAAARP